MRPARALIMDRATCFVSMMGERVLRRMRVSICSSRIIASTPAVPRPALFTSP